MPPYWLTWYYPIGDFVYRANLAFGSAGVRWISSWYRDPAHNARVGGHPRSQHLRALAIDVNPDARPAPFQNVGLTVVPEGDHLHVQYYP